jgi:hypothetical protein
MMFITLLHYPVVLFFSFTRPYIVVPLDYLLTQEKKREEKRRYEHTHRTVEVTPKGNEKDITTQNENEHSSATKVISHKGDIIQG